MTRAVHEAFEEIVLGGLLLERGMDSFAEDLDEEEAELIRQYIISRANIDRGSAKNP